MSHMKESRVTVEGEDSVDDEVRLVGESKLYSLNRGTMNLTNIHSNWMCITFSDLGITSVFGLSCHQSSKKCPISPTFQVCEVDFFELLIGVISLSSHSW